jgi:glutamine---fructose-6-phosphate transaminase (isomerizing)
MEPALFESDLESKPTWLRALADHLHTVEWPIARGQRVLLTGMGSSWFAADTVARRLRRAGVSAVAELASVEGSWPPAPDLAVIGISASGGSSETLDLLRAHHGASTTVALTNSPDKQLPAHHTMLMHAGPELSGVSCRSYLHTLVMLMQLEQQLAGTVHDLSDKVLAAADAAEYLLHSRDQWLPPVMHHLDGPNGAWLMAPAERYGNALQGALMMRETPRRAADGCETGDWNHVDVYLTKTLDYRALMFTGSRYDTAATTWMNERGSTWVAVGPPTEGSHDAAFVVRYPEDHDPLVALLTEVLVPELVSAAWWAQQ